MAKLILLRFSLSECLAAVYFCLGPRSNEPTGYYVHFPFLLGRVLRSTL